MSLTYDRSVLEPGDLVDGREVVSDVGNGWGVVGARYDCRVHVYSHLVVVRDARELFVGGLDLTVADQVHVANLTNGEMIFRRAGVIKTSDWGWAN